jgi:hypothetical protein
MENLIKKFLDDMYHSYVAWNTNTPSPDYEAERNERFKNGLSFTIGKKYIKIINSGAAYAFVVNTDNDDRFRRGDILKADSWSSPARNSPRGNILDGYTANWLHVGYIK